MKLCTLQLDAPARGRPAADRNRVVVHVRRRILSGTLAPGARLPSRRDLEKKLGVSLPTVQQGIAQLAADGFVRNRPRAGAFVALHPPHLSRYALIFPSRAQYGHQRSQYFVAIEAEARRLSAQSPSRRVAVYYEQSVEAPHNTSDYRKLVRAVHSQTLAGLIFVGHPFPLIDTPVLKEPGLPRVSLSMAHTLPGVVSVGPDGNSFFERALAHLASRGRRRVAIIGLGPVTFYPELENFYPKVIERMTSTVARHGLTTRSAWLHGLSFVLHGGYARNIAEVIMAAAPHDRPDAVIISDDNLVEHATTGLLAAGVEIPRDVEVVAHCNYPHPPPAAVPVTWLGFSVTKLLDLAVDCLNRVHRGEPVEPMTAVAALFEPELVAANLPVAAA